MLEVPVGQFLMGSPPGEPDRDDDEGPQHTVTIARPFAAGRYEVTFDEWDACVAGGGCAGAADDGWGRGRRPVIRVSYFFTSFATSFAASFVLSTALSTFSPAFSAGPFSGHALVATATADRARTTMMLRMIFMALILRCGLLAAPRGSPPSALHGRLSEARTFFGELRLALIFRCVVGAGRQVARIGG